MKNDNIVERAERAYRRYCSHKGIKCNMRCVDYTPRTETGAWIHRVRIWDRVLWCKRGETRPAPKLLAEYRLQNRNLRRVI
jgi:hypothetical protein